MKRTILILAAIFAAFTVTGVFLLLAKVGPLPEKVRGLDLAKTVKSAIADDVEVITEELPA